MFENVKRKIMMKLAKCSMIREASVYIPFVVYKLEDESGDIAGVKKMAYKIIPMLNYTSHDMFKMIFMSFGDSLEHFIGEDITEGYKFVVVTNKEQRQIYANPFNNIVLVRVGYIVENNVFEEVGFSKRGLSDEDRADTLKDQCQMVADILNAYSGVSDEDEK